MTTEFELIKMIANAGPLGVCAVILYFHRQTRKDLENERKERQELQEEVLETLRRVPRVAVAINALTDRIDQLNRRKGHSSRTQLPNHSIVDDDKP